MPRATRSVINRELLAQGCFTSLAESTSYLREASACLIVLYAILAAAMLGAVPAAVFALD